MSLRPTTTRSVFGFPETVNEVAARVVATGVVAMAAVYLVTGSGWVLGLLLYGFIARVLAGPTLSPLGQLATRVIVPALPVPERPVVGAPKRFAEGVGATLSGAATLAHLAGFDSAALALVACITVAATLESGLGLCLGCIGFGWLIRLGLVPEATCLACANVSQRLESAQIPE